jgi:hypothetical protein
MGINYTKVFTLAIMSIALLLIALVGLLSNELNFWAVLCLTILGFAFGSFSLHEFLKSGGGHE